VSKRIVIFGPEELFEENVQKKISTYAPRALTVYDAVRWSCSQRVLRIRPNEDVVMGVLSDIARVHVCGVSSIVATVYSGGGAALTVTIV
jgi:hypothetical protein